MATEIGSPPRFFHMPKFQHQAPRQLFYKRPDFAQQQAMQQLTFDGKRMRKAVNRKTIDYNPSVIKYLEVCSEMLHLHLQFKYIVLEIQTYCRKGK